MKNNLYTLILQLLMLFPWIVFSQTGNLNNNFSTFKPLIIDSNICFSPKDGKQLFIYLEERNYFKELNDFKEQQLFVRSQIIELQTSVIKNDSIKYISSQQLYTDEKLKVAILIKRNETLNKQLNIKNKVITSLSIPLIFSVAYILIKN